MRVLLFPCGSEIALEIHRALKNDKKIELIGANSIDDHGKFVFSKYISRVPYVDDRKFIPKIINIVKKYKIDYIYPCMDIAIKILKENELRIGCKVISSPRETIEICSSKKKTYQYLNKTVRTPLIFEKDNIKKFPIFSKPDIGSSSRFTFKIENNKDLNFYTEKFPKNLLLEYLPGEEYTVDCFTNNHGKLIFISPRLRSRIFNGISVNTKIIKDSLINDMAKKINQRLKFNGSWFFQIKKDINNKYCLLEVATRFGGSSSIQRYRGVNLPLMDIYNAMGYNLNILTNNISIEIDRSLDVKAKVNIKYKNVYVDFDDTIIIKGKVNLDMISALYYFVNNKKNIILITKHKDDIIKSLEKYKIDKNIFYKIIKLSQFQEKYKYMKSNSIFIDDSFIERKKVNQKIKIPTFSIDTLNIFND